MEAERAAEGSPPTSEESRRLYRLMVELPDFFDRMHEATAKFPLPNGSSPVLEAAERSREELAESIGTVRDLARQVDANMDAEYAEIEEWEHEHAKLLDNVGRLAQHSLKAYHGLLLEHACLLGAMGECEVESGKEASPFYPDHPDFPKLAEFLKDFFGNPLFELEHCRLEELVRDCTGEDNRLDLNQLRDELRASFESSLPEVDGE